MIYDYIIIGSGIGALSAGLNLVKNGARVLILEKNSLPGGMCSTFKRGRFEFDTNIEEINRQSTKKILSSYGLNVEVLNKEEDTKILDIKRGEELVIQGNKNEFYKKLEMLEPKALNYLNKLIVLENQIYPAYLKLLKGLKINKDKYPLFYKYCDKSVYEVLIDLKFSKTLINKFCYNWFNLGTTIDRLNFCDFILMIKGEKTQILKNKNISLTLDMVNRFERLGGKIYYNSLVIKILEDKNGFKVMTNKEEYQSLQIISDVSSRYFFKNIMKTDKKNILRRENAHVLEPNNLIVYLGLNKDAQEIGLNNYQYILYPDLDSLKAPKTMGKLDHIGLVAKVINNANKEASLKNTTIMTIQTMYFKEAFKVDKANYLILKEELANYLINNFEKYFKIDIKEYIEEIEIATPKTIYEYTFRDNGCLNSYCFGGVDNRLNRILNYKKEKIAKISFVGSSFLGASFDDRVLGGYFVTQKLLKKEIEIE